MSNRPPLHQPPSGHEPSMEEIRRTDSFVDALAGGRPVAPLDAADAELAALLGSWRDETRWPPDSGLITESDAVAALNAGLGERPARPVRDRRNPPLSSTPRRNRRGLGVVGAAAAAVLTIGGFGAVVSGAGPGDSLYGLRTMLFGAPKQVRDDQVALAARTEMQQVQSLIAQGDWEQAQDRLVAVSSQVASIGDEQQKQDLLDQFNDLSAKVVERDPAATAPPGITYTVPPSASELVPALAPTSTSSAPQSESATSSSISGTTTSPSATGSTTATSGSSIASTSAPSSSSASASTSASAAPTTTPTTAPSSAASSSTSQQNQQTTTPTSAAPTTSAPPRTTTASPSASPTTSAAPAAAETAAETPQAETAAETAQAETQAETTATETATETQTETTATQREAATSEAPTQQTATTDAATTESDAPADLTTTAVVPPVPVGG